MNMNTLNFNDINIIMINCIIIIIIGYVFLQNSFENINQCIDQKINAQFRL